MTEEDPLIQRALEKLEQLNVEIARTKVFINEADKLIGRPPRFSEEEIAGFVAGALGATGQSRLKKWQPGDFYNKPFAAAVRMYLESRFDVNKSPWPASVDEIHEALTQGSFKFDTMGADAQKNSIRISLGKNSTSFVRLPNTDQFGLVEWYGITGRKTVRKSANGKAAAQAADTNTNTDDAADEAPASSDNSSDMEVRE